MIFVIKISVIHVAFHAIFLFKSNCVAVALKTCNFYNTIEMQKLHTHGLIPDYILTEIFLILSMDIEYEPGS